LEVQAELCADIIAAKNKGDDAVKWNRHSLFDMFRVVLFPDQEREDDRLEMEMPAAEFRDAIEATKTELAQQPKPRMGRVQGQSRGSWYAPRTGWPGSWKPRHTVVLFEVQHVDDKHMGWDGTEVKPFG
jgi:hypothetical protein